MEDAKKHATSKETDTIQRILFKLILSPTLVSEEGEMEKGRFSQEFWDAHELFQNRDGDHNKGCI